MGFPQVKPIGINPPLESDRQALVWFAYNGDCLKLLAKATVNGVPATLDNSDLTFMLSNERFSDVPIWTGKWRGGIEPVPDDKQGRVVVRIPDTISANLERGSYLFSLLSADKLGESKTTLFEGTLVIEYAPTSPCHRISYKDGYVELG